MFYGLLFIFVISVQDFPLLKQIFFLFALLVISWYYFQFFLLVILKLKLFLTLSLSLSLLSVSFSLLSDSLSLSTSLCLSLSLSSSLSLCLPLSFLSLPLYNPSFFILYIFLTFCFYIDFILLHYFTTFPSCLQRLRGDNLFTAILLLSFSTFQVMLFETVYCCWRSICILGFIAFFMSTICSHFWRIRSCLELRFFVSELPVIFFKHNFHGSEVFC